MNDIDPIAAEAFAIEVVRKLQGAGFEALWAGGCVRDALLERRPKDYDVATSAEPRQVRDLFGHKRTLYLTHDHDGRDLQLENAEKTLAYAYRLWGREVVIETVLAGKRTLLTFNDRGFSAKTLK